MTRNLIAQAPPVEVPLPAGGAVIDILHRDGRVRPVQVLVEEGRLVLRLWACDVVDAARRPEPEGIVIDATTRGLGI